MKKLNEISLIIVERQHMTLRCLGLMGAAARKKRHHLGIINLGLANINISRKTSYPSHPPSLSQHTLISILLLQLVHKRRLLS